MKSESHQIHIYMAETKASLYTVLYDSAVAGTSWMLNKYLLHEETGIYLISYKILPYLIRKTPEVKCLCKITELGSQTGAGQGED